MSSRRNTAHDLNDAELEALIRLRVLRVSDTYLLRRLPRQSPTQILAAIPVAYDATIERRVELSFAELKRLGVGVVTVGESRYPKRLFRLRRIMPPVLFYRGDIELAHAPAVAMVGTRRSTEYGNAAAEMLAGELAARGFVIISGLALGIDAHAHLGALQSGGTTIAVLGCGINVLYPHRNARLQERIANEGLLLSEFAPGEPAMKHHFLERNRIIAVLGGGVVVVEAGTRSGSLNTAKWAELHSINVFAVPGPIGREASFGTNALLQDGTPMVISARDILDQLPWKGVRGATSPSQPPDAPHLSKIAARIYQTLGPLAIHIDQIARVTRCSAADALNVLIELELSGLVRQYPGKRFTRAEIRTA
jgi:DNA processing protein